MSKFSDKCKLIMQENGTNVYRLSNSSSLERTTLQRMVTGKRLPGIDFVKQFCKELRMSAAEEQQLMELYHIEQIGEDVYQNRMIIRNLLRYLANLEQNFALTDLEEAPLPGSAYPLTVHPGISYNTELVLFDIIEKAFQSDSPSYIYTNLPAVYGIFFHQLRILCQRYPQNQVSIEHLVAFQINASRSAHNLSILYHVLPPALSDKVRYFPWYHYSKVQGTDYLQSMFPYYIITQEAVLEISGDFKTHLLHTDGAKNSIYTREFERIRGISRPLLDQYTSPEDALTQYLSNIPPLVFSYVFEAQPCLQDMITDADVNLLLEQNSLFLRLKDALEQQLSSFASREIHGVFTRSGLDDFCQNGTLKGQIGAFLPPFLSAQRRQLLQNLLDRPALHHRYMLSDDIVLPAHMNFEIYESKQINMIKIDDNLNISFFVITESSICDAFWEFASSFFGSDEMLSEENTNQYIKKKLEQI